MRLPRIVFSFVRSFVDRIRWNCVTMFVASFVSRSAACLSRSFPFPLEAKVEAVLTKGVRQRGGSKLLVGKGIATTPAAQRHGQSTPFESKRIDLITNCLPSESNRIESTPYCT